MYPYLPRDATLSLQISSARRNAVAVLVGSARMKSNNPKGRPKVVGGVADQRRERRAWVQSLPVMIPTGRRKPIGSRHWCVLYKLNAEGATYHYVRPVSIGFKPAFGEVIARLHADGDNAALFRILAQ